jgi:predicted dehydrogenase
MSRDFKWGIIGLGRIAQKFAEDLNHTEHGILHAVASRSLDKAKDFAAQHQAMYAYGDYEHILNRGDLDAIYIATPHNLHFENTMMCLRAGIPVLCEKPFAMNFDQVQQMVDLARENNVFLMEALWTRFLPHYMEVKEIVDAGILGPITNLKADFGFVANEKTQQRLFRKSLGGGSLLDIGIYPIFVALDLLGTPEKVSAKALFGDTGVDMEVDIKFQYGNTCQADLQCTLLRKTPSTLTIKGELGVLEVGVSARFHEPSNYELGIKDKKRKISNFKYNCNGYKYEADEVANCIRNGQTESDRMSLDFSLRLMSLLDHVRKEAGIYYFNHDIS